MICSINNLNKEKFGLKYNQYFKEYFTFVNIKYNKLIVNVV